MRTKEFTVFMSEHEIKNLSGSDAFITVSTFADGDIKAKLIIELPERKVTISETEFDEVIEKHRVAPFGTEHMPFWQSVKNELFGEQV